MTTLNKPSDSIASPLSFRRRWLSRRGLGSVVRPLLWTKRLLSLHKEEGQPKPLPQPQKVPSQVRGLSKLREEDVQDFFNHPVYQAWEERLALYQHQVSASRDAALRAEKYGTAMYHLGKLDGSIEIISLKDNMRYESRKENK